MPVYSSLFKHLKLNLEIPGSRYNINLDPDLLRISTLSNVILNHFDLFEFKVGTPTLEELRSPSQKVTIYINIGSIKLANNYNFNQQTISLHNLSNVRKSSHSESLFNIITKDRYGDQSTKFEYIPISNIIYICHRDGLETIFGELNTALLFLLQLHNSAIVISKESMRLPPQFVQETLIKLIEELALDEALAKLKLVGYDTQVNTLLQVIRDYTEEQISIDLYIKESQDKLEIIERRHLFGQVSDLAEDMRDLLHRHTLLDHLEVTNDENSVFIHLHTNPLTITKYDKGYLAKSISRMYSNANSKFTHAFHEFAEGNATINLGEFILVIVIKSNGAINIVANPKEGPYNNPHNQIHCLGTYGTPMTKLRQDQKPIEMILLMLEYIQSINFKDSGSHRLYEMCYITDEKGERIFDANSYHTEESPIEDYVGYEEAPLERADVARDPRPFQTPDDITINTPDLRIERAEGQGLEEGPVPEGLYQDFQAEHQQPQEVQAEPIAEADQLTENAPEGNGQD